MLSWFSFKAIMKEVKRHIKWPTMKELVAAVKTVIIFILLFVAYLYVVDMIFTLIASLTERGL